MKLERGEQTNNSTGDTLTSFSQAMIFCDLGIGKFVQTSGLLYQKAALFKPLEISTRNPSSS
jgi:hypothetical protein